MDWRMIIFWVIAIALGLFALFLFNGGDKKEENNSIIRRMTVDAAFIAIIIAMSFIPNFGYITVAPGVSLTLIHIPVLLGCYLYGPKRGLIYGAAFGITSWIQANINPAGFNFFFIVPWVSVLPRLIFAFIAGLVFTMVKKNNKIYKSNLAIGALSLLLTLLHTILVFACLYIFYYSSISEMMASEISGAIVGTVAGVILVGAAGESVLSAILIPLIGKATRSFATKKRRQHA